MDNVIDINNILKEKASDERMIRIRDLLKMTEDELREMLTKEQLDYLLKETKYKSAKRLVDLVLYVFSNDENTWIDLQGFTDMFIEYRTSEKYKNSKIKMFFDKL